LPHFCGQSKPAYREDKLPVEGPEPRQTVFLNTKMHAVTKVIMGVKVLAL
jgi:hypothetical protein